MNQVAEPSRGSDHRRLLRHWPLLLVTIGVVIVGLVARAWMHSNIELIDDNDVPMLGVADTALGTAIGCALLVVAIAHLLLDRERARIEQELIQTRAALRTQLEQEAQARRTGMLGALAGGLAHELGQPLSVARVGIEGLHYLRQLGREPTPEQVEVTLARVGMSLVTMTQTIEHLRADLTTYHKAIPARTAEVNPSIYARVGGFLRRLPEALKRTRDARIRPGARHGEVELVGPEEAGQYLGPGRAQDGVV